MFIIHHHATGKRASLSGRRY